MTLHNFMVIRRKITSFRKQRTSENKQKENACFFCRIFILKSIKVLVNGNTPKEHLTESQCLKPYWSSSQKYSTNFLTLDQALT